LPDDLLFAAVRMLGQAYSVATAPAGSLPPEIARIGKAWVFERAVRLAQAGLHVLFGETVDAAVQEAMLDWLGNDRARFDVLLADAGDRAVAERDLRAWDALRRAASAGDAFTRAAARVIGGAGAGRSPICCATGSRCVAAGLSRSARRAATPASRSLRDPRARLGSLDPPRRQPTRLVTADS
jgi:hypothetical protein